MDNLTQNHIKIKYIVEYSSRLFVRLSIIHWSLINILKRQQGKYVITT